MKKLFLLIAVAAFMAVSCDPEVEGGEASLKVTPTSLSFDAKDAAPQRVTVEAKNVKWDFSVVGDADAWLTPAKDGEGTLVVSVQNNSKTEPRTGVIKVLALDNKTVSEQQITVTQAASEAEPTYSITVTPTKLTFDGEGAAPQEVTITTEGDFTWSSTADDKSKTWITLTPQDGKLMVSVGDNPTTEERSGTVTITPSESSVGARAVRVIQAGKILPPSLTADKTEINLGYKAEMGKQVIVTAVNVNWTIKTVAEDGATAVTWINVKDVNHSYLLISAEPNELEQVRRGYVILTPDNASVAPVRIHVIQAAGQKFLSTLTESVEITDMNTDVARCDMTFYTMWHSDATEWQWWAIDLWGNDLNYWKGDTGYKFIGSGTRIYMDLYVSKILPQDDVPDPVYYIPDGVYPIGTEERALNTVYNGTDRSSGILHPSGSWYQYYTNDKVTGKSPFINGTVTISRSGDLYTFTFDVTDDAGYTVTGTCKAKVRGIDIVDNRN